MSKESNARSGGITVAGLLGVSFVVLKLTGQIDWPWWWVTFPFWAPLALAFGLMGLVALIALLKAAFPAGGKRCPWPRPWMRQIGGTRTPSAPRPAPPPAPPPRTPG